jgi:hypothetical protein
MLSEPIFVFRQIRRVSTPDGRHMRAFVGCDAGQWCGAVREYPNTLIEIEGADEADVKAKLDAWVERLPGQWFGDWHRNG